LIDLDATNGTILNGEKIDPRRYVEIRSEDIVKFGESTREYVFIKDPSVP
jgi:smad nuclear-interacting protein 1